MATESPDNNDRALIERNRQIMKELADAEVAPQGVISEGQVDTSNYYPKLPRGTVYKIDNDYYVVGKDNMQNNDQHLEPSIAYYYHEGKIDLNRAYSLSGGRKASLDKVISRDDFLNGLPPELRAQAEQFIWPKPSEQTPPPQTSNN